MYKDNFVIKGRWEKGKIAEYKDNETVRDRLIGIFRQ